MRARTITDRQPYLKAHKNYDELHDLLGNLQGKLSEVSKDVDKEFLASYRVHMLSIQTEIKNLREDVDKGVQALKSDGNVHKLELEVNWFVEECTRLRLHYTTMENDCFQMQSRYKAMMDQKVYMNEQLKAILKRNRVLEAEIEHALKYNQKVKLADDQHDEQLWDEHKDEQMGFDDLQNSAEATNDDLPPDNYYHEQLRRLSEKSPLSTSVFVPPVGGRRGRSSKGSSRQGSRPTSRGSSRGSSRSQSLSPSRTGTPGSPNRPAQGPGGAVLNKAMVSIRSHHSAEHDDDDEDIGFEDAAQRQFAQDFQQAASLQHSKSLNSLPAKHPLSLSAHFSQQQGLTHAHTPLGEGNLGTEASRRGPVPKQQPLPAGVWRARQKVQAQKHRHNREQLVDFLKHKSPAEASLEKAIADIFTEVRARKVVAAKRGAIKRYPVSFMGNEDNQSAAEEALQQQNNTMLRKRSGASVASLQNQNQNQNTSFHGGAGGAGGAGGDAGSPMAGTALGRRLSASAQTATNTNTANSDRAPHEGDLGNEEQDLLRQPLIQATGGISGLGAKQLSDNDKFSVVVKYLLDYDRFRELVDKLQQR